MSSAQDFVSRFAGTTGVPDGGETLVKDFFKRVVVAHTPAFEADDNNQRVVVFKNPFTYDLRLIAAEWIPDAAVTADNTNFSVVNLYHTDTPASGTDKLALTASTTVAGTGNLTAETPETLTVSTTEANKILEPGEYAVWHNDGTNGTGVDLPIGRLVLVYEVA
jgi:hypothetical protein